MPRISATGEATPKTSRWPDLSRGRGFTLLELMVVLTIMVLIAGAMPLILNRALPSRRVATATDKLMTDIRWLQTCSIASGKPTRLDVLPSGYQLDCGDAGKVKKVPLANSTSLTLRGGVGDRVITAMVFHPDGTSSAGRFEFADAGRQAVVQVSMLTGRVRRVD